MPELKPRRVRSIRRILVRPTRQSWGAFATSVFGGSVYVIVSKAKGAPEGGAHAVAVPARWLDGIENLDVTTWSSYDFKLHLTDIVLDTDAAHRENRRLVNVSADRGEPVLAIIPLDLATALNTDQGHLTESDFLQAPRVETVNPADLP